jgi:hypothetical protein
MITPNHVGLGRCFFFGGGVYRLRFDFDLGIAGNGSSEPSPGLARRTGSVMR